LWQTGCTSPVYNTCTTCHFGTQAKTFDVLGAQGLAGGRFYDSEFKALAAGRTGVSFHTATGYSDRGLLEHWQAPGSGITEAQASLLPSHSRWRQQFTCGSCHAPHGSYSARHLHYNPNGSAVRGSSPLRELAGYPGVYVTAINTAPWLYYDRSERPDMAVAVFDKSGSDITEYCEINYSSGEIRMVRKNGVPGSTPATVVFSRAKIVVFNGNGSHKSGISDFCVSCHVNFMDVAVALTKIEETATSEEELKVQSTTENAPDNGDINDGDSQLAEGEAKP